MGRAGAPGGTPGVWAWQGSSGGHCDGVRVYGGGPTWTACWREKGLEGRPFRGLGEGLARKLGPTKRDGEEQGTSGLLTRR